MTSPFVVAGNEITWYLDNTAADDANQVIPGVTDFSPPSVEVDMGEIAYQGSPGPTTTVPYKSNTNHGEASISYLWDPTLPGSILAQLEAATFDNVEHTLTARYPARAGDNALVVPYTGFFGTRNFQSNLGDATVVQHMFRVVPQLEPMVFPMPGSLNLAVSGTQDYNLAHYFFSQQDSIASYVVASSDDTKASINAPTSSSPTLTITGVAAGSTDVTVSAVSVGNRTSSVQTISVTVPA